MTNTANTATNNTATNGDNNMHTANEKATNYTAALLAAADPAKWEAMPVEEGLE